MTSMWNGDPGQDDPPAPRRGPGWLGVLGIVLAGMLLSSGVTLGGVIAYDGLRAPDQEEQTTAGPSTGTPSAGDPAVTIPAGDSSGGEGWQEVAAAISPSTVAIEVQGGDVASQGTGVITGADGTIVTNNHVVAGGDRLRVSLADGDIYEASVVGADASTDIAVIRIDAPPEGLQPAAFADSEEVVVGQPVMAVGTPLGLADTVTSGLISAVDRPVTTTGEGEEPDDATYTSALQTDAAINPGNSGGPLVNDQGEVIGINSSIAGIATGEQDSTSGSIGLGFAIPANTVTMIADQLVEDGTAEHAFLGVSSRYGERTIGDVTHSGAEVQEITEGSAAAAAGLETDDLITEVDDVDIEGSASLTGVVRGLEVGQSVEVGYIRDGEEATATVTLGSAEE